jgi:hypothetical protein
MGRRTDGRRESERERKRGIERWERDGRRKRDGTKEREMGGERGRKVEMERRERERRKKLGDPSEAPFRCSTPG